MNRVSSFLVRESTVVFMIVLNALALFWNAFPSVREVAGGNDNTNILFWIDYICVIYFLIEAFIKIKTENWRTYWANGWNRFDFLVVMGSLPSLLDPWVDFKEFSVILVLRVARLFRFFRVFRFIPNGNVIWQGVIRALRVSVAVMLTLFILNLIFGLGATMLFHELPNHEKYFGDPITSTYSLFKVFTVEGWYNIPDELSESSNSLVWSFVIRGYFVVAVIVGIVGLSLANAVFVNEVTTGNTDQLKVILNSMREEIETFRAMDRRERAEVLDKLSAEIAKTREKLEEMTRQRGS
jgi:voltage-gated sodium channel